MEIDETALAGKERMRQLRVLVAEDDEQGAKLIGMVLRKMEIGSVIHAKDGKEAWDAIANAAEPFSLIISDWNMPNMTGIQLLEKVRTERIRSPFIMITGRGMLESAVEAKTMGVTSYISKPYTPQQLMQKITSILTA